MTWITKAIMVRNDVINEKEIDIHGLPPGWESRTT